MPPFGAAARDKQGRQGILRESKEDWKSLPSRKLGQSHPEVKMKDSGSSTGKRGKARPFPENGVRLGD